MATALPISTSNPGGIGASIGINFGGVLGQLAHLPSALIGVIGELNYDLMSHHRLAILKHNKLPSGRGAQAMIATRLHRYGRKRAEPQSLDEVVGESFAAADKGETYGPTFFEDLEKGRDINAGKLMAIPIGALALTGGARAAAIKRFREQLANHELIVTPGGALINKRKLGPKALKQAIVGILSRNRTQRPLLGFFSEFERIWAAHLVKYEKAAEMAMTAAGQEALAGELQTKTIAREAASSAYIAAYRAAINANPNATGQARKVAKAAAKLARAEALGEGRA